MDRKIRNLLLVLVFLFFVAAMLTVSIYGFGWDSKATRLFVKTVPLPAAMVGGKFVTISEVNAYEEALKNNVGLQFDPSKDSSQSSQILTKLIEAEIVQSLLNRMDVPDSEGELDRYYQYVLSEIDIDRDVAKEDIGRLFNWSEREFVNRVVQSNLNRDKLAIQINKQSDSDAYKRAVFVRGVLEEENMTFGEAAELYSDDLESKALGGEIGVFDLAALPPWLVGEVDVLEAGEQSGVVVVPEGFAIYRAISRFEDKIHLARILIKGQDVQEYIENQKQSFKIYTFGRI